MSTVKYSDVRVMLLALAAAVLAALLCVGGGVVAPSTALAAEGGGLAAGSALLSTQDAGDYRISLRQTQYSIDLNDNGTARVEYTLCTGAEKPDYVFYADELQAGSDEIVKYSRISDYSLELVDGVYACDGWIEYTGIKPGTAKLDVYILVNGERYDKHTVTFNVADSASSGTPASASSPITVGKFNSKGCLVHKGFTIESPRKGQTYSLGKAIGVSVKTKEFIPVYVNGFLSSKYNYVYLEIWKDGKLMKKRDVRYSTVSDLWAIAVGQTSNSTYKPTQAGTYAVKVGFANTREGGFDDGVTEQNIVGSYTFKVVKPKANSMTAKAKTVTFKYAKVKKKAQSVKASKAFTVKKARGKVTYKVTKYVTKAAKGKVKVASNGKVTVKKGAKKGTYRLKVKVTAAGNATYKSGSKTVTLKVRVK